MLWPIFHKGDNTCTPYVCAWLLILPAYTVYTRILHGYAVKVNCNNEMQKDSIGINDRLYYPCYIANYNT